MLANRFLLKSQDSHARNAQCIFTTAARSNGAVGLTLKQNAIRISHDMCTYGANLEVTQHQITGNIERVF